MKTEENVIVGAGLVGSLLALYLNKLGEKTLLCEKRGDLRKKGAEQGRSINLVITDRGLRALRVLGLEKGALELTVPVEGRVIHDLKGRQTFQPYGIKGECNYSIGRSELNAFLLDAVDKLGIQTRFSHELKRYDVNRGELEFEHEGHPTTVQGERIWGTDGSGSVVRAAVVRANEGRERIDWLSHSYKELTIPGDIGRGLKSDGLHIWPRGDFLLMALPNRDKSFTVTLYLPNSGPHSFDEIKENRSVVSFFEEFFPDAIPLIPELETEFDENPVGVLGTVYSEPWIWKDRAILLGDAAHGIVPFFGQGMNAGFEDCEEFYRVCHEKKSWVERFQTLYKRRKANTDAIARMALENFIEMREKTGEPQFVKRKKLENLLEREFPHKFRSRYALVMYSHIPYKEALECGKVNARILNRLCENLENPGSFNRELAVSLLETELKPFLERKALSLEF